MPDYGRDKNQPSPVDVLPFIKKVLPLKNPNEPQITSASPSLIQRLFGNPVSQSTAQSWPELNTAWQGMKQEYPQDTAQVPRVAEMGMLSKLIHGDADAVTGPFGTIHLNREVIKNKGQDINDVLAHELTHVGQGPMRGLIHKMFGNPEVESQAVNREGMRAKQFVGADTSNIPLKFRQNLNVRK